MKSGDTVNDTPLRTGIGGSFTATDDVKVFSAVDNSRRLAAGRRICLDAWVVGFAARAGPAMDFVVPDVESGAAEATPFPTRNAAPIPIPNAIATPPM
jgi:hypothetical protein